MYRAYKTFSGEQITRKYHIVCDVSGNHYLTNEFDEIIDEDVLSTAVADIIDPDTLEIFLFGEWIPVSELETKYKLVDKAIADIVPCPHRGSCVDYRTAVKVTRRQ